MTNKFTGADILGFAKSVVKPKPREIKLNQAWQSNIDDHVISLEISADGKTVAAAGIEGKITLFDAATGNKKFETAAHNFGVSMLSLSRDGRVLTSAGQDGKIKLWDGSNGELLKELEGGAAWVERVRWSPHSNIFVSTAGKKVKLWTQNGDLIREYPEQNSTVVDVAWSPASEKFVTACYGGLTQWRAENAIPAHKYEWKGSTLVIAWSPNGQYIATGDQDSTVHFWKTKDGTDLQMWGYPTKVKELAWDSTSHFLATGGGGNVTVWDCKINPEGSKPLELKGHENFLSVLKFQPVGMILASGDLDGKISLWDLANNGRFQSWARLSGEITNIAWAQDNRTLAAASANGEIKVFTI